MYFLLIVVDNQFRECRLKQVIIKGTIWQQLLQNLLKQIKNEIILHACQEQIYHDGNNTSLIFVALIRENITFQQLSKIVLFPRPPLLIEQVSISGHTSQGYQYLIQHFLLPLDRVHMKMPKEVKSNVRRGDDSVGVEEIAQLLIVIWRGVNLLWIAFDEGLLVLDRHRFKLMIIPVILIMIKKDRMAISGVKGLRCRLITSCCYGCLWWLCWLS